ncbi:ABC transporter permease [Dyadobacter sp. 3J3]|uniref:ABC transporter permease n=1 Tax=Dyadobacter sp. 3J3 TaxID=2606600 RepID=UPI00135847AA|nr:ABC transporter permease [Dyadobacter sp. 3J3]
MLKNHLKIALRNLWKHKAFSLINILGLTVGMSACLLIGLYVHFELSYDNFHSKAHRIYRLVTDVKTPSETLELDVTTWAFAPGMKNDFPEVEAFTRINTARFNIRKDNIMLKEEKALYADSSLFKVFDFQLLNGNPSQALKEPLSIVLTEKTARKYFGNADPIGQILFLSADTLAATVTGVMKDIPENSQIKADMFISMSTFTQKINKRLDENWGDFGVTSYLLLKTGSSAQSLQMKLPAFLENHAGEMFRKSHVLYILSLEPLKQVYLHSSRGGAEKGSAANIYIFSAVAIFILLIACINFINLSTARSAERAKEVGIRKSFGAGKMLLARQFLIESLSVSILAFLLSLPFSSALIPWFNGLAGKAISKGLLENPLFVSGLFITSVVIGLLAGIYPAVVLSSFEPVTVLKGRFTSGLKGVVLRKSLVTIQFSISIILIIATLVVYTQMTFMRERDLGFSKEQMLIINSEGDVNRHVFQQTLDGLTGIQSTATSSSIPGGAFDGAYSEIENKNGDFQVAHLGLYLVDFNYMPQYKLKMAAGRMFSKDFRTDSTEAMIVNEAAVKLLGYSSPLDAVGKKFKQWGHEGKIIGVMKDFHFVSLHETIKPLTMRIDPAGSNLISVKIGGNNIKETLDIIESKWKLLVPNRPFNYYFADEFFDRQYRSEEGFEKLFFNFAMLAIFISCLGLLGLASHSTIQRTREIGVRKVLGASTGNIVGLLSKDFLVLVVLAFIIASPLAFFCMDKWLQNFAYKTNIQWWIFAVAAILSVAIAFGTISYLSIRAALTNPVKSLKAE